MKLKKSSYTELAQDLQKILRSGQLEALNQLQKIRSETYWKLGERLAKSPEVQALKKIPAEWLEQLTQDLKLDRSLFYRVLKFYQTYPKGLPQFHDKSPLAWSTHVALLPLQDPAEREFYLKKAVEQGWTEKQLRDALKQNLYAVVGAIHESPQGKQNKKSSKQLKRPTAGLYLYTAVIERVIDGDTLLVSVDLGFDVWKKQRLRLRAIDCPELKTPEGQAAKAFVQEILQPNDFVILKTYKMDLHGRFVCDVFFLPGEKDKQKVFAEGTFLNQLLVEQGQAVVV